MNPKDVLKPLLFGKEYQKASVLQYLDSVFAQIQMLEEQHQIPHQKSPADFGVLKTGILGGFTQQSVLECIEKAETYLEQLQSRR